MTTPMFRISGLGSGLDTASMISQLMQVERQPIVRLENKQADLRAVDSAWSSIVTKLSGLRSAVQKLRQPSALSSQVTVESSSTAVAAKVSGVADPGAITFSVERLATRHQIVAGSAPFSSATAAVGQGSFVLRGAGGETLATITTDAATTLTQLAAQINGAQDQVSAQVVRTGDDAHRLVLTARSSGAAGRFSIDTDLADLAATPAGTTEGVDAHLKVGSLDVYRSSNSISDLVPGVELTLRETTTGPVTLTVERDLEAMVKQISGYVEALNGALAALKGASRSDSNGRGVLAGDSLVRSITDGLRNAASGLISELGGPQSASAIGISVQRDGTFTLDEAKLRTALSEDLKGVADLFARSGRASDVDVGFVSASAKTQAGAHEIEVTAAARVAVATGAAWTPPSGNPKTFSISSGGRTVQVTIDVGEGVASAVAKINAALRAAGLSSVIASDEGGALRLTGTQYGSAAGFDVSGTDDPALDGEHRGTDVVGTIGGQPATGRGQVLTAESGPAEGLSVRVTATQARVDGAGGALALGALSLTHGIAARLEAVLDDAIGGGGSIARARDLTSTQIRRYDERIAEYEDRLLVRERALRAQFLAMETALAQMSSQSSWMASAFPTTNGASK